MTGAVRLCAYGNQVAGCIVKHMCELCPLRLHTFSMQAQSMVSSVIYCCTTPACEDMPWSNTASGIWCGLWCCKLAQVSHADLQLCSARRMSQLAVRHKAMWQQRESLQGIVYKQNGSQGVKSDGCPCMCSWACPCFQTPCVRQCAGELSLFLSLPLSHRCIALYLATGQP